MSNGNDNNPIDDKELDSYLSGSSEYSRRYRAVESDGVPPELDRLVLTEASASAGNLPSIARKRSRSLGFWMRVSAPVALAASVVLVVSVVIRNGMQTPTLDSQISPESAAPSAPPQVERLERADATTSETEPSEEAPPTRAVQANATPTTPPAESPASRAQSAETTMTMERVVVNAPAVQRVPQDVAIPVEVITAEDLEATDSAAQKQTAAIESRRQQEQAGQARDLEEIVVTGQLRRAPAPTGAGPRGTVRPTGAPSDAEIAKEERETNPEQWLRHIRELRADGKQREADREWRNFIEAYPNYEVGEADAARPR